LGRINLAIILWRDLDLAIQQADFNFLDASLAPEVLFHPVSSKISGHAFHAHFDMPDLRFCGQGNQHGSEQEKHGHFFH
jgi:hypothetical protein